MDKREGNKIFNDMQSDMVSEFSYMGKGNMMDPKKDDDGESFIVQKGTFMDDQSEVSIVTEDKGKDKKVMEDSDDDEIIPIKWKLS